MLEEYGDLNFVLDLSDSLLDFGKRFFKKNTGYQNTLTVLKYGIPATVLTTQLISKIRKYQTIKSGKNTVHNEREARVKQALGLKFEKTDLCNDSFYLGRDVFFWLFQKPKTELFKILGFYAYENLTPITDVWSGEKGTMVIVIEFEGKKLAWVFSSQMSVADEMTIRESTITFESSCADYIIHRLKGAIYKEFLNHFDIKNNVIMLSSTGLQAQKRQQIKESIHQFDLDSFSEEIKKVLIKKKKRGYAFVGIPGTGKSTIIRKLEGLITEYPIIYTTAANYDTRWSIQETFTTVTFMQPCIVVMEDLDSYELRDKKGNLGVFLDLIDDVNSRLNAVFIATINDTSLVHYTLINRPGRFDQVILIKPPQSPEEVYGIMRTRYNKSKSDSTEFLSVEEIGADILESIVSSGYTQADICEIIEKALLMEDSITVDTIRDSLGQLGSSKQAIQQCNFKGDDPRSLVESCTVSIDVPDPA
jgi:energy-coupling factor transporter ATP-binding protein EcfA2